MNLKQMAREAYHKVEALEGLLVAKGVIESGEAEAWIENLMKEEGERREAEQREFWNRLEDNDWISCYGQQGRLRAKSKTPWKALVITTVKTKWGYSKSYDHTCLDISPSQVVVERKDGQSDNCA